MVRGAERNGGAGYSDAGESERYARCEGLCPRRFRDSQIRSEEPRGERTQHERHATFRMESAANGSRTQRGHSTDRMDRWHCGNLASTEPRRARSRHAIHTLVGHSCAFLRLHGHLVYARPLRWHTHLRRAGYPADHHRCARGKGAKTCEGPRSL